MPDQPARTRVPCRTVRAVACAAALLMFAAAGSGVLAQGQPATTTSPSYFKVTGVDAGDVLNIRSEPHADAKIVGRLAPDAGPVEVIESEGDWGLVIAGEGNGWVSMRFLEAINMTRIGNSATPVGTVCSGTEPFWSLTFARTDLAQFSAAFDADDQDFQIVAAEEVSARPSMDFIRLNAGDQSAIAFISREYCSDGMSDRLYGQRIALAVMSNGGLLGLDGCCRVPLPDEK